MPAGARDVHGAHLDAGTMHALGEVLDFVCVHRLEGAGHVWLSYIRTRSLSGTVCLSSTACSRHSRRLKTQAVNLKMPDVGRFRSANPHLPFLPLRACFIR